MHKGSTRPAEPTGFRCFQFACRHCAQNCSNTVPQIKLLCVGTRLPLCTSVSVVCVCGSEMTRFLSFWLFGESNNMLKNFDLQPPPNGCVVSVVVDRRHDLPGCWCLQPRPRRKPKRSRSIRAIVSDMGGPVPCQNRTNFLSLSLFHQSSSKCSSTCHPAGCEHTSFC